MSCPKSPAIGIDLGTWKCCVGVVREGKVEIIENERGSKTTPSYVAFTETERLVGEDAKNQVALNPTNTIFGAKRIIGRRFDDAHVKTHLVNFPFETKQVSGSERIEIRIQYKTQSKWLPPEHITAMLLRKMKLTAEAYLGCPVHEAVVSVPVCFNSGQRQATLDAAEIAGLKVLQLLHEPTAVALAYKDQVGSRALHQTVMVVDAGGGTLQAAVVSIKDGLVDVKAVSGNTQFGGCDLDKLMVDECVKKWKLSENIDISKNKKATERLRFACHKAKCDLTLLPQTTVQVDSLVKDKDFKTTIQRTEFYKLFRTQSDKLITDVVMDALKGAHLHVKQIDEVLVVGGSTRIPSIITRLEDLFPGKQMNRCVNMDEAVAYGAALQAALLAGDHTVADTKLSDVTPRNFFLEPGIHKQRGILFRKNCKIPREKIWNVSVGRSGKQTLHLQEDDFGLKPVKSYSLSFGSSWVFLNRTKQVLIKIDENGLVTKFSAPDEPGKRVSIPQSYTGISDIKIHKRVEESFQTDEQNEAIRLQAMMKLESTCFEIKSAVKGLKNENDEQQFEKTYGKKCSGLITSCDEYIDWLDGNREVTSKYNSKIAELEERFEALASAVNSIKSERKESAQNSPKHLAPEASDAFSATQKKEIESVVAKKSLTMNHPTTEKAQFDIRNKPITLLNEKSTSSINQNDHLVHPVGVTNRDQYSRPTEQKLHCEDDANSLNISNLLAPVNPTSPVSGACLISSHEATLQNGRKVRDPSAYRPSSEYDVMSEKRGLSSSVQDNKSVDFNEILIPSTTPVNETMSLHSPALRKTESTDLSSEKPGKLTCSSRSGVGGTIEAPAINTKEKNSIAFDVESSESSNQTTSSKHDSKAKDYATNSCATSPSTINGSGNRLSDTGNGSVICPNVAADVSGKSPSATASEDDSDYMKLPITTSSSAIQHYKVVSESTTEHIIDVRAQDIDKNDYSPYAKGQNYTNTRELNFDIDIGSAQQKINRSDQHHAPPQQPSRPHGTKQQNTLPGHQRKSPAIGIDLGTWKCCVGVVHAGKVEIIENERGSKTTPSYVAFTETERLVGEDAKDQVVLNPTNTIFGVKQIIGRRFDDQYVKTHIDNLPFSTKPIWGSNNIEIHVQYNGQSKWLPPEHITAMLLRKMKLTAEAYLGCLVHEAVVSVPACFNSGQRQATLDAAEIAGLKVLQLLHEPTAVALAYKDQVGSRALNQTVMVVDAGGGTLQAAVMSIKDGFVDVKAVSGNTQFGGCDLDKLMVDDCVKKWKLSGNIDISRNKKATERLRVACHKAKCDLTLRPQTTVQVDSLVKDKDFKTTIQRTEFYKLFLTQSDKLITDVVMDALEGAHLHVKQIDEVLVVGGASQIPAIITHLEGLFLGKKLNRCVNMDEAVAHGAAVLAAQLAGDHTVSETLLSDVTPRDFYLEHASTRDRGVVFRKNDKIPNNKVWRVSCNANGCQTLHLLEDDFVLKLVKSYSLKFNSAYWFREKIFVVAIDENGLFTENALPIGMNVTPTGIVDMKMHQLVEVSFRSDQV